MLFINALNNNRFFTSNLAGLNRFFTGIFEELNRFFYVIFQCFEPFFYGFLGPWTGRRVHLRSRMRGAAEHPDKEHTGPGRGVEEASVLIRDNLHAGPERPAISVPDFLSEVLSA